MADKKKTRKKAGRPTKFSKEIADTIITYVKAGSYVETAAIAAGISKETFYDWLKKGARYREGKSDNPQHAELMSFSDAVKIAQATSEIHDLMIIGNAAKKNWTASAWRLERKFPERWGRRERQDINVSGVMGVSEASQEEQQEYQERVASFFADPDEILMSEDKPTGDVLEIAGEDED